MSSDEEDEFDSDVSDTDSEASLWGEAPSYFYALDPPGLYVMPPGFLSPTLLNQLALHCALLFKGRGTNQVMIFESAEKEWPYPIGFFLNSIDRLVRLCMPRDVRKEWAADKNPRVVVINVYRPGEGISPHVDMPHRYGPIVVGVSMLSDVNMHFTPARKHFELSEPTRTYSQVPNTQFPRERKYEVELADSSVYVLSGEARYDWKHSVPAVEIEDDLSIPGLRRERELRMSVTVRKLLPGADMVGASHIVASQRRP